MKKKLALLITFIMILSNIMKNVKVSRDYEIEIDLTLNCEDIGISLEEKSIKNLLET